MDPLSITAAALALLGACTTASRTFAKIRRLKNAPEIIQSLNNEVTDLRLVMLDAADYINRTNYHEPASLSLDGPIVTLCSSTFDQVRKKILAVETPLHYRVLKAGENDGLKVNKTAFLRAHDELARMQTDLRILRLKLAAIFNQIGMKRVASIEVVLNDVVLSDLQSVLQSQSRIEDALHRVEGHQRLMGRLPDTCPSSIRPTALENAPDASSFEVSVSRLGQNVSRPRCNCRRQQMSVQLNTFLGSLFLGYAAAPVRGSCSHHSETELRLIYCFPLWFLNYALLLMTKLSMSGTISCSLTITQTLPDNHIIFDLLEVGDAQGITKMISSSQMSIRAVNQFPWFSTPLCVSLIICCLFNGN